ncbi:MAG: hypothetical protein NVSMB5_22610 [Candidatus Velthaea sp.]
MRTTPVLNSRLVLLWFAGVDLRLTLLAVPPLIPLIHRGLGLDETGVAALTNIPVLLLSAAAIPGSLAIARFGAKGSLIVGLWLIAIASMLRGVGSSIPVLFAMTFLMGTGIAMAQPALPTLVRQWESTRISFATSVWANGLLVGEALSASLTIPVVLPLFGGAWQPSIGVWGIPVALTAIAFMVVPSPKPPASSGVPALWLPNFRDSRVWKIGIFQSAASLTYFGANTFIPDYLHSIGRPELVAPCLSSLNIGQLPASLIIGLIPLRVVGRRESSIVVALAIAAALAGFVIAPGIASIVASAMFGFCAAYILVLSFALPALLAHGPDVARLSAGTFTIGYAISFIVTELAGAAWDATHQPALAFLPLAIAAAIVLALGTCLGAMTNRIGTL